MAPARGLAATAFAAAAAAAHAHGDGGWRKEFPPWDEPGAATEGAPQIRFPLIGPFTGHSCFPSRYMSMRLAVSHVNRRDGTYCPAIAQLTSSFQFAYDLADTQASGSGAAQALLPLLANETARAQVKVVLGPNSSGPSKTSSQLLSVFGIPQISWAATNADLSNKGNYPNFFRSVSPDSLVMRVMAGFVHNLGYRTVNVVYFDAPFQSGQARDFIDPAQSVYSIFLNVFKLPSSGMGGAAISPQNLAFVRAGLQAMKNTGCRVVMALSIGEEAWGLFQEADNMELLHESGWIWFGADGFASMANANANRSSVAAGVMYIIASAKGPGFDAFADRWAQDMPSTQVPEFTSLPTCKDGVQCQGLPEFIGWVPNTHDTELKCRGYTSLAYDAVVTLAVVADRMLRSGRLPSELSAEDWHAGLRDLHESAVVFECLSGQVSYDANQERPLQMVFQNFQPGHGVAVPVADWSGVSGYSWRLGSVVVWPTGEAVTVANSSGAPPGLPSGMPPVCAPGWIYDIAEGRCVACPTGSRQTGAGGSAICELCLPGRHQPLRGQVACSFCPAGRAATGMGLLECAACGPGRHAPAPGAGACADCEPGSFANTNGSTVCMHCAVGSYQPEVGRTECISCSAGKRTPEAWTSMQQVLVQGRLQWVPSTGATNESACGCQEYWWLDPAGECQPCGTGAICGGMGEIQIQRGYYAMAESPGSVFLCGANLEKACAGGATASCADGRLASSIACARCQEDYRPGVDGTCTQCAAGDVIGVLAGVLAFVLLLGALSFASCLRPIRQHPHQKASMAILGLLATFVQILSTLSSIGLSWGPPFQDLLNSLQLVSVNLEVLHISCIGIGSPILTFGLRMLTPIAGATLMGVAFLYGPMRVRGSRTLARQAFFNAVGQILVVFSISLGVAALSPFQCYLHPNGMRSVTQYPHVICWESVDHQYMMVMAILGVLVYPVGSLSLTVYGVYKYPREVVKDDLRFLQRFRFLFLRWTPGCYWFGLVMIVRNLAIALLPTVIPPESVDIAMVLTVLTCIITSFFTVRWLPWSVVICNWLDVSLSMVSIVLMLMAILAAAGSRGGRISTLASSVLFGLTGMSFCVCTGVVIRRVYLMGVKPRSFSFFISHHKGGGACAARFLKLLLAKRVEGPIFLDNDYLDSLEGLFDSVKQSKHLLVILSGETMCRPWCVGEIVTAHQCRVPMRPITVDNAPVLSRAKLDKWQSISTGELTRLYADFDMLKPHGISLQDIEPAMNHLLSQAPLHLNLGDTADLDEGILTLLETYYNVSRGRASTPGSSRSSVASGRLPGNRNRRPSTGSSSRSSASSAEAPGPAEAPGRAESPGRLRRIPGGSRSRLANNESPRKSGLPEIILISDPRDVEATASARFVKLMLQELTQKEIAIDATLDQDDFQDLLRLPTSAEAVVLWLVTKGTLKSAQQVGRLAVVHALQPTAQVSPVVVGDSFEFPNSDWYEELTDAGAGLGSGPDDAARALLEATGVPVTTQEASKACWRVFQSIPTYINVPHATEGMLRKALRTLAKRVCVLGAIQRGDLNRIHSV